MLKLKSNFFTGFLKTTASSRANLYIELQSPLFAVIEISRIISLYPSASNTLLPTSFFDLKRIISLGN